MVVDEKDYVVFSSVVMAIASKKHKAGTDHEEAEPFVTSLFNAYMSEGLDGPGIDWITSPPKKATTWITQRLAKAFSSSKAIPKWLDEPSWRYLGDQPMDFVHQFETGNDVGEQYEGLITYVFFGRRLLPDAGWELVVKMVQQSREAPGTTFVGF